jgi:hypothetical protein
MGCLIPCIYMKELKIFRGVEEGSHYVHSSVAIISFMIIESRLPGMDCLFQIFPHTEISELRCAKI